MNTQTQLVDSFTLPKVDRTSPAIPLLVDPPSETSGTASCKACAGACAAVFPSSQGGDICPVRGPNTPGKGQAMSATVNNPSCSWTHQQQQSSNNSSHHQHSTSFHHPTCASSHKHDTGGVPLKALTLVPDHTDPPLSIPPLKQDLPAPRISGSVSVWVPARHSLFRCQGCVSFWLIACRRCPLQGTCLALTAQLSSGRQAGGFP